MSTTRFRKMTLCAMGGDREFSSQDMTKVLQRSQEGQEGLQTSDVGIVPVRKPILFLNIKAILIEPDYTTTNIAFYVTCATTVIYITDLNSDAVTFLQLF